MKNQTKIIISASSALVITIVSIILFKYFQRKSARIALNQKILVQSNLSLPAAFNTTRWKTGKPAISDATARSVAQKVHTAIGWFSEDEDKISQAFYSVKNYDDLSLVAYQFNALFSKDLNSEINSAFKGDNVKLARLRSILAQKVNK